MGVSHHTRQFSSPPGSHPISSPHPCCTPTHKREQSKVSNQANKSKHTHTNKDRKISLFLLHSCLSNTSSFILMALGAVCHITYPFVQSGLLANVHRLAQGLWFLVHYHHWVLTETPPGYLVAAPSYEDPSGFVPQDQSLHELQQVSDRVMLRWANPIPGCGPG